MERVNMGDKPAPAISTEVCLYKTAATFREDSPNYVDDLSDSQPTTSSALQIAEEAENMLDWEDSSSNAGSLVAKIVSVQALSKDPSP